MKRVFGAVVTTLVVGFGSPVAASQQEVLAPDTVVPAEAKTLTATLYTDGKGGVRIKDEEAQLFMTGDVIKRATINASSNAYVCKQRTNAKKRDGSRSCGFLGLQRCPVYKTRVQECGVAIQCDYLLWRAGETKTLCDRSISATILLAPSDATANFKTAICQQECDKDKTWTVTGSAGAQNSKAGLKVGSVTYHIERTN